MRKYLTFKSLFLYRKYIDNVWFLTSVLKFSANQLSEKEYAENLSKICKFFSWSVLIEFDLFWFVLFYFAWFLCRFDDILNESYIILRWYVILWLKPWVERCTRSASFYLSTDHRWAQKFWGGCDWPSHGNGFNQRWPGNLQNSSVKPIGFGK